MNTFVNLVATRCKNGDHAALFRWYNDHVHILMQFDAMLKATLYRCAATNQTNDTTAAPEYICLYEFASQSDFMAFEVSDAREQARQVLLAGWGKDGIEITERKQFWRLGTRTTHNAVACGDGLWHFQSLRLGAGPAAGVARWLNDSLHRALDANAIGDVAWHRAVNASDAGNASDTGDALVMAQTSSTQTSAPSPLQPGWWLANSHAAVGGASWGHAPETTAIAWQAPYRRLCVWGR